MLGDGGKRRDQTVTTWKLFWVIMGAVASVVAATLLQLVTAPIVLIVPLAAVVALVVAVLTAKGAQFAMLGALTVMRKTPPDVIQQYSHGIGLAAALHIAWITATRVVDGYLVALVGAITGLALLEYWTAVVLEYLNARRKPKPSPRDVPRRELIAAEALIRAGYPQLSVTGSEPVGFNKETGRFDGVRFTLQLAVGKQKPPVSAEEDIANAFKQVLGAPLNSDWVQLRASPGAGEYTLTVTMRDTKVDIIPYVDSIEPTSITEPHLVGYDHDKPVMHPLNTNGQNIGQFGSGKSSLTNVQLAHLTRCTGGDDIGPGAVVWICGVEKLYELVGEWVEPYFDTDYDLPFDWIANGQTDTVIMLVTAMNIARWRQRQPIADRIDWPYIIVVLDEAGFAFRDTTVTARYQGQWVNASQAAANLTMGARSGNVHLIRNSQRSTLDHGGPGGGDISANMGWTAAFRSKDDAEIGRLTGDYTLKMPRHKGEFWFDPGTGEPILLKAPYIQETSRNRPRLHDGATIGDVSWARRHLVQSLDPGSAAIGGEAYARRHTRMNDAMRNYLTGDPTIQQDTTPHQATPLATPPAIPPNGDISAYDAGYQMMMKQLTEMFPDYAPPEPPAPPPPVSVVTMVGRRSRADRIAEILNASDEPVSYEDLVTELRKTEDPPIPDTGLRRFKQVVSNALGQMVEEERIRRLERGMYSKAS